MRTRLLLKFTRIAALAAVLILSVATIQSVWWGIETSWGGLFDAEWVLSWGTLIDQLVMGTAIVTLLSLERIQERRTPGIALASGLVGTTLFGMATFITNPDLSIYSEGLALCFALGLMMVLVRTRRRELLWPGMAALLGAMTHALWLVGLAISFM
jgi:hypothetical protein